MILTSIVISVNVSLDKYYSCNYPDIPFYHMSILSFLYVYDGVSAFLFLFLIVKSVVSHKRYVLAERLDPVTPSISCLAH